MSSAGFSRDLVILAADQDARFALQGILRRHQSLRIRALQPEIYVHQQHDPGVFHHAHDFLRAFSRIFHYALVILDHEGSGQEDRDRKIIQNEIQENLERNGWKDRSRALVLDPELEIWVWSDSPIVASALGWGSDMAGMVRWLQEKHFLNKNKPKPSRPKEAYLAVLKKADKAPSSSIFEELASQVGLDRCEDAAFLELKEILQQWFPQE
jgi:hypothetical protein